MKRGETVAAFAVGALFGVGLAVSHMTNPEKVLGFLTLARGWDASLLLVMGSAVLVTAVGYRWALGRQPIFGEQQHVPTTRVIDARLVGGAAIFGLGWGLAGYCPGPALAGLVTGSLEPIVFLVAMLVGSEFARRLSAPRG